MWRKKEESAYDNTPKIPCSGRSYVTVFLFMFPMFYVSATYIVDMVVNLKTRESPELPEV